MEVKTVPGSVVRSVGRRLSHSLESKHWNGVLAVSFGAVRNGNERLKVAVKQLPIQLSVHRHQQKIVIQFVVSPFS